MYVIDRFNTETLHGKSPWTKQNVLSLVCFVPLDKIPKIKICCMVASEHPEVIEGMRQLIATDVLDSEEAAEDSSVDNDGAASGEENESGLGEAGVSTGVNQSVTEEVEEVQQILKHYFISSYMLKPTSLLTHGFK